MRNFQHVILGTGQATGTLLGDLLSTGDSIAVIEGDRVGGTCVNTGDAQDPGVHGLQRERESLGVVDGAKIDNNRGFEIAHSDGVDE